MELSTLSESAFASGFVALVSEGGAVAGGRGDDGVPGLLIGDVTEVVVEVAVTKEAGTLEGAGGSLGAAAAGGCAVLKLSAWITDVYCCI